LIMKRLQVPVSILQRMALLRMLPHHHIVRKDVIRDLKKFMKGYYGERDCCYYLSLLPDEKYLIFHALRLKDKKEFQMDIVLLSRAFILIIEVKNIAGKLIFKKGSDQVIQVYENEETGLPNPIAQVNRQRSQFLNWLNKWKIKGLPVEHLVINSKTSTIIETTPDNMQIFNHLIFAEKLLEKIQELEERHPTPQTTQKTLTSLSDFLLQEHLDTISNLSEIYNLSKKDLIIGVNCPLCKNSIMKWTAGNWVCIKCKSISKTAHLQTVDDYFFIIGPTITRREFREFLQIESDVCARRKLLSLNLPHTGTKRGTKYYRPPGCILSQEDSHAIEKGEYVIP
jgi:ribosomal protein L37AE/L43A